MSRPPRGMGAEDSNMLGGVSSQRIDVGFNALSARLMHQEHLSRAYHGGSPGGPCRGDSARKFRSEATPGIGDNKSFGAEREHFMQRSERDFNSGTSGILSSVEREESSVDGEGQRIGNGGSHVSNLVNTSARVSDWVGSERTGGMAAEADYRDLEERGGASSGSQSEGSEEDDEDDGNIDGEADDSADARMVDRGQKGYEGLAHAQIGSTEGRRESLAGPMLGHAEGNSTQNGTMVAASGLSTPSAYYRDGTVKDSRDTYVKERQNFLLEQGRAAHNSSPHEAVPVGAVTSEAENYYTALIQTSAAISQKDPGNQIVAYSHRKIHDTMEMALRSALTDPLTGALMDDATILSCGHSFGSDGLQRVLATNACISCGVAAKKEDMTPNYALRSVVQVFRREEDNWKDSSKSLKRRRERPDQDRHHSSEFTSLDVSRYRGVQFPYKVNDRVLIKGNKRTPERFVGRNAVITTQCLNGWYVVRTLDNGESVKLQYRSLMKMGEQPSSNELQPKVTGPSWL